MIGRCVTRRDGHRDPIRVVRTASRAGRVAYPAPAGRRAPAETSNVFEAVERVGGERRWETEMKRLMMIGAVAGLAILPAWLMAQTAPAGRGNAGTTRRSFEKFTV